MKKSKKSHTSKYNDNSYAFSFIEVSDIAMLKQESA